MQSTLESNRGWYIQRCIPTWLGNKARSFFDDFSPLYEDTPVQALPVAAHRQFDGLPQKTIIARSNGRKAMAAARSLSTAVLTNPFMAYMRRKGL